jgi:chorismate mutase
MNSPFSSFNRNLLTLILPTLLLSACAVPARGPQHDADKLANLMVERLEWMDEVAAIKQARSLPVSDPARETELLKAMQQRGANAGIPAAPTRAFFTGQFAAAKQLQIDWLQQHPKPAQRRLPDLKTTVRPALDRISADMISHLFRLRTSGSDAASTISMARQKLLRAGFSERVIAPALEGLDAALRN